MRVGRKSDPSLLILYAVQDVGLDYNDKVFIKLIVTYNKTNCLSLPYHCATTVDYKLTSSTGNTLKASMYDHYINQQLTSMLLKSKQEKKEKKKTIFPLIFTLIIQLIIQFIYPHIK